MVIKLFKNLAEKVFSVSGEVGSQNSVENESLLVNEIDNSSNLSAQELSNLSASASDVVAAYKIFLKRLPESMEVTNSRVGLDTNKLLLAFFCSDEFLHYPENRDLVMRLSEQVQEKNARLNERES
jgi:hypothetical protein